MARPKRTTPWLARRGDQNNGVFYAYWYDEEARETKRISLATTVSSEAETKFAEFLLNGREIRLPRPKGGLTVDIVLDDYRDEHVNVHCTDKDRQIDAITHLKAFFGGRLVSDIDVPLSQEYTTARTKGLIGGGKRRKAAPAAPSTVRRELNVLVAAANHAVWMKRAGAVAVSVDLPPEKRLGPDDEAPYYSFDELDRIFDEAKKFDDAREAETGKRTDVEHFIRLLYQTGARRRSIEDLELDQVKMRERRIILQKAGKKTTKKRQPIVPILSAMEPTLKHLIAKDGVKRLFDQADYYRQYKQVCKSAGIDDARSHPHIMRHTRATHLLQNGKSIYDVAKFLGDTIVTVERVYGHHSADHLANRLED